VSDAPINKRFIVVAAAALFVGAACAARSGRESSAPAKSTPAGEADAQQVEIPRAREPGAVPEQPVPIRPSPPPAPAAPRTGTTSQPEGPSAIVEPGDSPRRVEVALRAARTEVEQAQRELEVSMSECTNACRALGSMERATGHLCDLATERDDRRRCEDAKTAVLRARDRIRKSCGSCPGGPSLEKTAPIPSRP